MLRVNVPTPRVALKGPPRVSHLEAVET